MKNKKGFTLVELLAVIAILAVLVIIALPNVINMYTKAKKEAFLTETKKLYSEAEKKYISSSITGTPSKVINSEDNTKLDMTGEKLKYCVILNGQGKVKSMKVSNGEWVASLDNNKKVEDLSIDDLEEGNLDNFDCSSNKYKVISPEPIYCTFDGEMVQGAEYVNGQYTYRYMQGGDKTTVWSISVDPIKWKNISEDGWGVQLTDKNSKAAVSTQVCTFINNKPIVSMSYMLSNSKASNIDLSSFNTANVIYMDNMFIGSKFTSLELKKIDTSNVIDMSYMFNGLDIESLDLGNFDTRNVKNMKGMFSNAKINKLNVSGMDTNSVTNMSWMFLGSTIPDLDIANFDTSNVTDMSYMFYSNSSKTLDLSNFDTKKVTDMSDMFYSNKAEVLDLRSFDTSNVTNMRGMFNYCKSSSIDISSFNTSKVTDMSYMFGGSDIKKIDLTNLNTSNVTTMECMFENSNALSINVSNLDTNNVTNMRNMFFNIDLTTLDLRSFDTSNVTNMSGMFAHSKNLKTIYSSNKFNINNVSENNNMFLNCTSLIGGNGTKHDNTKVDKTYARIDTASTPGYFTKK